MTNHPLTRREILKHLALTPVLLSVPLTMLWGKSLQRNSSSESPSSENPSSGNPSFGNSSSGNKKKWASLFDGKSLSGWHVNPEKIAHGTGGLWQVEKGVIVSQQDPPGSGNGGMLLTDNKFSDFELELDVMPDWGVDSGVFIRTNNQGECFQIYVDYHDNGLIAFISTEGKDRMYIRPFCIDGKLDDKGNLKELITKPDSRPEAWGSDFLKYHCTPEIWKKTWKIGKWNTLRIRCTGKYPHITTWMNNVKIMEFDGETCRSPIYRKEQLAEELGREGHIAMQVHGGTSSWVEGAVCRWKNIKIKEIEHNESK